MMNLTAPGEKSLEDGTNWSGQRLATDAGALKDQEEAMERFQSNTSLKQWGREEHGTTSVVQSVANTSEAMSDTQ